VVKAQKRKDTAREVRELFAEAAEVPSSCTRGEWAANASGVSTPVDALTGGLRRARPKRGRRNKTHGLKLLRGEQRPLPRVNRFGVVNLRLEHRAQRRDDWVSADDVVEKWGRALEKERWRLTQGYTRLLEIGCRSDRNLLQGIGSYILIVAGYTRTGVEPSRDGYGWAAARRGWFALKLGEFERWRQLLR